MAKSLYLLAALLISTPVLAQTTQAPQAVPVPLPPNHTDVNKIVCERQEEIGSRLKGKKVCMTVEQWKEFRAENRNKTEELQRQASVRPSG